MSRQRVLNFGAAGLLHAVPMGGWLFFRADEVEGLRYRLVAERSLLGRRNAGWAGEGAA